MLTQVSLMPLITMPHVHGDQRGAECSSGQRDCLVGVWVSLGQVGA